MYLLMLFNSYFQAQRAARAGVAVHIVKMTMGNVGLANLKYLPLLTGGSVFQLTSAAPESIDV
jgi:hypothetical protein